MASAASGLEEVVQRDGNAMIHSVAVDFQIKALAEYTNCGCEDCNQHTIRPSMVKGYNKIERRWAQFYKAPLSFIRHAIAKRIIGVKACRNRYEQDENFILSGINCPDIPPPDDTELLFTICNILWPAFQNAGI